MNSNLQFDFTVDKKRNALNIKREFAANQQLVWDVHTKSELLDQWFAPRPWKARTKTMDFSEGGYWLHAMCGPEGEEHWGIIRYEKINPINSYTSSANFCDDEGNIINDLPGSSWITTFKSLGDTTLVEVDITYNSLEDLETVMQMGMKEGFTMALEGLDELIEELKK